MQSTPNLRDADPHDVFVIEPDVSLAARADKAPLDVLYDVLSNPSAPRQSAPEVRIAPDFSESSTAPSIDAAVRETAADELPVSEIKPDDIKLGDTEIGAHQPAGGKIARGVVMALFALGSAMVAAAWQHYGDDAKAMMARYVPPFALASFASAEKPKTSEQAVVPAAQALTANNPRSPAAETAAPASAAASPEQAQAIQSMARDLAAMGQQITELKASLEQLKASQPQMANAPARTTEARLEPSQQPLQQSLQRPRIVPPPSSAPVHAAAPPVRKPKPQAFPYAPISPTSPPAQQAAAGPAPMQIAPQAEDGGPLVRPPMPLR